MALVSHELASDSREADQRTANEQAVRPLAKVSVRYAQAKRLLRNVEASETLERPCSVQRGRRKIALVEIRWQLFGKASADNGKFRATSCPFDT